jgi:hypothetical protein
MTIQLFLEKHKDYKLNASGNRITIEVECSKRQSYPTDEEISDLNDLGYYNIVAISMKSTDQTMCTCGWAIYSKTDMSRDEKIAYIREHQILESYKGLSTAPLEEINRCISAWDKAQALGAGADLAEQRRAALQSAIDILRKDYPAFDEENSTGWDMIQSLTDLCNNFDLAEIQTCIIARDKNDPANSFPFDGYLQPDGSFADNYVTAKQMTFQGVTDYYNAQDEETRARLWRLAYTHPSMLPVQPSILKRLSQVKADKPITIILLGNGEVQVTEEGNTLTNYQF